MQDTACGCNCPFVKQGFCGDQKECPNYMETWWIEGSSQEQKLVKDCAPKRILLQHQSMQNQMFGLQQALEQSRNEYNNLSGYLVNLIEMSKNVLTEKQMEIKHEKNTFLIGDSTSID